MMEQTFTPREDGRLVERERHISILPEEKYAAEFLTDRNERHVERQLFLREHRRKNLRLIPKVKG